MPETCLQLCGERTALVQIGAAAKRGAESTVDATAMLCQNILFYLLRYGKDVRKDGICPVKPVIVDADQMVLICQRIQHTAEIGLIVAAGARRKKDGLSRERCRRYCTKSPGQPKSSVFFVRRCDKMNLQWFLQENVLRGIPYVKGFFSGR